MSITIKTDPCCNNYVRGPETVQGRAYRLNKPDCDFHNHIYIRTATSLIDLQNKCVVWPMFSGDEYVEVDLEICVKEKK